MITIYIGNYKCTCVTLVTITVVNPCYRACYRPCSFVVWCWLVGFLRQDQEEELVLGILAGKTMRFLSQNKKPSAFALWLVQELSGVLLHRSTAA